MPLSSTSSVTLLAPPFHLGFAAPASGVVLGGNPPDASVALPWLAGDPQETIFNDAHRDSDLRLGHATLPLAGDDPAEVAQRLYRDVLQACAGQHLYRIWNYVPAINATRGGLENYRAFCAGRAAAFEEFFGDAFEGQLPAASAVGSAGDTLDVVFAAGPVAPRHVENPEQVPAYRYPIEHGPRAPSFARGSVVDLGSGTRWVFVSGTAAIKGHVTMAVGSLAGQIDCMLDNLRLVAGACGLSSDHGTNAARQRRHLKVYLRHARDLADARARLERAWLFPTDHVTWLQAEICRAALDIEIEMTVVQS